jgi:hypothetical protein
MSFSPWKFARNPPLTVPSPSATPSVVPTSTTGGGTATNSSRATVLSADLIDLAGTAVYLQGVILSLTKGLGITVNTASNPDLGRALSAIYGAIPPAVSMLMYSNLLDVEFGAQQLTQAAGTDATIQPNPFQNQAVVTINKAVEAGLAGQGDFSSQLPLMLRSLKTQATVYTAIASQLTTYPAAAGVAATASSPNVIPASTVDVGDDVNDALTDHVAAMGLTYASAFSMMAGISSISQDIGCMVNTFANLATSELAQVKSLFTLVQSTDASESLQDISNGLTSFVFVQLMSDASSMVFSLDRIAQMAIAPLKSMTNSLGAGLTSVQSGAASSLIGVLRTTTQDARVTSGALAGLITSNSAASACGTSSATPPPPAAPPAPSPSCSQSSSSGISLGLSSGMQELSTILDWSMAKANSKISTSLNSFKKLMTRTQSDTCNQVKLLTMVNNLGTLSSLADSFLKQQQSTTTAASSSTTLLSTVGSILATTQSGNGASYTVSNGVITVTPPAVPAPTAAAAAVLSKAGVQTAISGISQSL